MRLVSSILASAVIACAAPAIAHTTGFTAALSGDAEAPPNTSPGMGWARVVIDDHDYTMKLVVSFKDLIGGVSIAHIHCCTADPFTGTAGVATSLPSFPGFPSGVMAGNYVRTFDMLDAASWNPAFVTGAGGTTLAAFNLLLGGLDDGGAYMNIHTSAFPGGEIRGFLAPVPEASSMALMLGGLGLLGWVARRQQRA